MPGLDPVRFSVLGSGFPCCANCLEYTSFGAWQGEHLLSSGPPPGYPRGLIVLKPTDTPKL